MKHTLHDQQVKYPCTSVLCPFTQTTGVMDDDEFYRLLSFIRLSSYRQNILKHFHEQGGPRTPTDIATATGINVTHVSHHLIKMKEHDLVTVINPDAPRHRYYRLTEKGQRFVDKMADKCYLSE